MSPQTMPWETSFTRMAGCDLPVQQAPMGAISTPALAAAVAAAGGLGMVSGTGVPAEQLAVRLRDLATSGAVGVNFVTDDVDLDAVSAAAEEVDIVDFFWSEPDPSAVFAVHTAGALACWQVGSVEEARAAVDAGCDLLAAQGVEAGGHVRGHQPREELLDAVLAAVDLPVLAAGGVVTADQVTALLDRGAAGVRVGTSFVATHESGAHPRYKAALVEAGRDATVVSDAFARCPLCATSPRARVLRSAVRARAALREDVAGTRDDGARTTPVMLGSGAPPDSRTGGRIDAMALYAGEGAAALSRIRSAAEALAELTPR